MAIAVTTRSRSSLLTRRLIFSSASSLGRLNTFISFTVLLNSLLIGSAISFATLSSACIRLKPDFSEYIITFMASGSCWLNLFSLFLMAALSICLGIISPARAVMTAANMLPVKRYMNTGGTSTDRYTNIMYSSLFKRIPALKSCSSSFADRSSFKSDLPSLLTIESIENTDFSLCSPRASAVRYLPILVFCLSCFLYSALKSIRLFRYMVINISTVSNNLSIPYTSTQTGGLVYRLAYQSGRVKILSGMGMPAALILPIKVGFTPVHKNLPMTLPPCSMPCCSYLNSS